MVGQAIEVAQQRRRHRLFGGQLHHRAFRATDNGARQVGMRRAVGPAWQDEASQRRQRGIHRFDLGFQSPHRCVGQPQPIAAFAGHRQVGADVEQVVLDAREHGIRVRHRARRKPQHADDCIRLVDRTDRLDARRVLAQARTIAE